MKIFDLPVNEIIPDPSDILRDQGIPPDAEISGNVFKLAENAEEIFRETADPKSLICEISKEEFSDVFFGNGENHEDAPVGTIYSDSDSLALFALTIGKEISEKIEKCFNANDFALGSMLDSAASLAAENSVGFLENYFLGRASIAADSKYVLGYSPGYCGWNISGQQKLFEYLKPERIGITLNSAHLMTPLKSVTGVLICGEKMIHVFDAGFEFCRECRNQTCVERISQILKT